MCIRDSNQVDHRSYEKQGKLQIPTIHEGADARKIEQKFLAGQEIKGSWKVAENQIIKQQNTLLQKILDTFGKVSGCLLYTSTYGQPEVVPISLPQVATGLRSRLPGSFRRRGFQPDLLMPQEALFASCLLYTSLLRKQSELV